MSSQWIPADDLPLQSDSVLLTSDCVLATDGKSQAVCYVQYHDTEIVEYRHSWKIDGQDGYEFKPTHWMPLPKLPGELES